MGRHPSLTASDVFKTWRAGGRKALASLPDGIVLRCDRIDANAYGDIADILLRLHGPRRWSWGDPQGVTRPGRSLARALAAVGRDALCLPVILRHHRTQAAKLLRAGRTSAAWHTDRRPLYLRMDHLFDLAAGGSVAHTAGVINTLRSLVGDVTVLSTDRVAMVEPDAHFHVLAPRYRMGRNVPTIPLLTYNRQVMQWWKRHRFEPGFVYGRYSLANYAGPLIARAERVPYVCEYNGSSIWVARNWTDRPLRFESLLALIEDANLFTADLVVAVSEASRDELLSRGVPAGRIIVNPNGVDPDLYSPDREGRPLRARLGVAEDESVIGFIGTFGKWHGTPVLAEAFGRLVGASPPLRSRVRLLLVGDGVEMPLVREILDRHGVADRAILAGLVPQAEAPVYLAACDILASPHVPNPDGTPFFGSPTKLFEYMAMGRAIVASDLDQISQVLTHGRTAWMVPPSDAAALSEGLRTLVDDAGLRRSLGAAARAVCIERHSWRHHTQRILDALRERAGGEVPA